MCVVYIVLAGALMYLNEATLLNNLRLRYMKDGIYAQILTIQGAKFIITPDAL